VVWRIDYGKSAYGKLAHMANQLWQISIWQKDNLNSKFLPFKISHFLAKLKQAIKPRPKIGSKKIKYT